MNDFIKYLTVAEEDKDWGLFLNVTGKSKIVPTEKYTYPSSEHPTGYYFTWGNGRILEEFQLVYITEGTGVFEDKTGKYTVKPGHVFLLRPEQWHRYRPSSKIGWTEYYIGFKGTVAEKFLSNSMIPKDKSILFFGIREEFIDTYYKIFEIMQKEEPGYQQIASGLVIKLLGYIIALNKQRTFTGNKVEEVIQKARFQMREKVEQNINLRQLAEQSNIGYSYFRKMFKKYTGISPHQYHLELRIMRAKELILSTDKSVKEISYELGFQSIYYFSRLFKDKTGITPSDFRKRSLK